MSDADLRLAAYVIAAATLAGISLYALYPLIKPMGRVWWPGALHGLAGLGGFVLLVGALRSSPVRGAATGASSFGVSAAVLIGAGLLLGVAAVVARWRGRAPGVLVLGIHATLAVAGLTMLAAYLSAPV